MKLEVMVRLTNEKLHLFGKVCVWRKFVYKVALWDLVRNLINDVNGKENSNKLGLKFEKSLLQTLQLAKVKWCDGELRDEH